VSDPRPKSIDRMLKEEAVEEAFREKTLSDFTLQPPKSPEVARLMDELRASAIYFAERICDLVPDSQERATAIERLSEVLYWAIGGIARNQDAALEKNIVVDVCLSEFSPSPDDPGPYQCKLAAGHEGPHEHQHGWDQHGRKDTW
jgi:hypothetical protein